MQSVETECDVLYALMQNTGFMQHTVTGAFHFLSLCDTWQEFFSESYSRTSSKLWGLWENVMLLVTLGLSWSLKNIC